MKGFGGGDTIGRWWGWIWTRARAGVKSKAGQSESRSWCKVRLTSQSGGRVYGVSSIWANPNPLLHGQCLQLFHPQAEASKIECKSGICERTVDLASQHETLLTERWLSLLPWGRKMTWFSSQATPLLQMNYYTRIKNSFSCKNRLLLLEPPATFFFLFRGWSIVMGWRYPVSFCRNLRGSICSVTGPPWDEVRVICFWVLWATHLASGLVTDKNRS